MKGILVFRSLAEAVRNGFAVYDRTESGYVVRARTDAGWVLAIVEEQKCTN